MKKHSVLVVEDSEIDQYIVKYMIQKFDPELEILQALDGQEALEILTTLNEQPIVIFLDINMPRMNGHEFLKEYEQSQINKTPVVMLSSSFQKSDREQCLMHKCVKNYIAKPIDVSHLDSVFALANNYG
ncbi:response regulator [Paraglaciecola aquimarina]|uniref:Response regulator n=1 Tax=Paraglaciecola aquimarina TaxID=1235557 RepID=A0ABU3SS15_9ALTE|nr:response regulator [Paraglaciecola aquimarina]MDU0352811.1 response regulator [Paraglaciecola aquimarina]